jgi:hypothetical protein
MRFMRVVRLLSSLVSSSVYASLMLEVGPPPPPHPADPACTCTVAALLLARPAARMHPRFKHTFC